MTQQHCTRSETNEMADTAVRRVKEEAVSVWVQSAGPMERRNGVPLSLAKHTGILGQRTNIICKTFNASSSGQIKSLGAGKIVFISAAPQCCQAYLWVRKACWRSVVRRLAHRRLARLGEKHSLRSPRQQTQVSRSTSHHSAWNTPFPRAHGSLVFLRPSPTNSKRRRLWERKPQTQMIH